MSFPHVADEISADWVASILDPRFGALDGVAVQRIGNGLMGENLRISLRWRSPATDMRRPQSLVAKLASGDATSRSTGVTTRTYEREIRFYQEIAPRTPIRTAHCYVAELDPVTGEFILLLEDLAPAEVGDQLRGCTVAEARLAIDVAADLHAAWWDAPQLAEFDWLSSPRDLERGAQLAMLWDVAWPLFQDRHRGAFRSDQIEVGARFGESLESWANDRPGPYTVTHGDFRVDNLLFAGGPDPWVVPVDWQTPAIGSGIGDVAYFLGASLLVADRRAEETALVRRWIDRLGAAGVSINADRCWLDYRRASFGGVLMAVAASMLAQQTDRGDRMFAAMFDRHTEAALDLEGLELLR